jgi:hypothetical protein
MQTTNAIQTSTLARIQARMNATQTVKTTSTTQTTTAGRTTSDDNSDAAVMARMTALLSK